ncbi:MAG: molybdopterin converting factor [Odoribacter sp.]|nr:molybdopterin converting factor [Odoribacter sp.]
MTKYLTEGPVTADLIASEIKKLSIRKDTGGHSIFLGQVRDDLSEKRRVKAIEYSAYDEMVNVEAERIKEDILNEFSDVLEIVIIHAAGTVRAGEISMFVLVSAGHRDQATKACRQAVELIKKRLPVWKREIFEDDTYRWQENT